MRRRMTKKIVDRMMEIARGRGRRVRQGRRRKRLPHQSISETKRLGRGSRDCQRLLSPYVSLPLVSYLEPTYLETFLTPLVCVRPSQRAARAKMRQLMGISEDDHLPDPDVAAYDFHGEPFARPVWSDGIQKNKDNLAVRTFPFFPPPFPLFLSFPFNLSTLSALGRDSREQS
jgi:hypothetical protein